MQKLQTSIKQTKTLTKIRSKRDSINALVTLNHNRNDNVVDQEVPVVDPEEL